MGDTPMAAQASDNSPQQIDTPPYPGTTRIENGQAFDVSGKALGAVDDNGKATSAAPQPSVDYDALAKQAGSVGSASSSAAPVDYDALAKQAGSVGSTAQTGQASQPKELAVPGWQGAAPIAKDDQGVWAGLKRNTVQQVSALYHAFTDEMTPEEKSEFMGKYAKEVQWHRERGYDPSQVPLDNFTNPGRASLALHRLVDAPGDQLSKKADKELEVANDLWHNRHGWKAADAAVSGAIDTVLSKVPLAGPMLNAIAERAEQGDISGAMTDLVSVVALEHAPAAIKRAMISDKVALQTATKVHAGADAVHQQALSDLGTVTKQAEQAARAAQLAKDAEQAGTGTAQQRIEAGNIASKAAAEAQKAHDAVKKTGEERASASMEVDRLNRKISKAQEKLDAKNYEEKASEETKGKDYFQKAVPSKGSTRYSDEDYDVARAHLEEAKANGKKIVDLPSAYEAVEEGRQNIEDQLQPYIEKYKDEPLTDNPEDSPKMKVAEKLNEMAKVDGNFEGAMGSLSDFNLTDLTVGEAKDTITKLNNYQRAAMKSANNWDIYNMIETKPDFAARYFMSEELRSALHDRLESHGVESTQAARAEQKSLINVRDAIGAQIRANRGGTAVRGSGTQSRLRQTIAQLTGKAIKGGGIAVGAEVGGPVGAVAGGIIGETLSHPVQDLIAPRDITRDQHIEKSMSYKGTSRKPVQIKGAGTPAVIPTDALPPAVKLAPQSLELTPRENTDLHADLAAHFGETNLEDSTYQELEQQLRDDAAAKKRNGVPLESGEKALLNKILKADAADRAIKEAANKPGEDVKIEPDKEKEIIAEADKRAAEGEATKLNPHLVSLGRGDESGLVSHSVAMKAHAPATVIPGMPEGMTTEDGHLHEWAHTAIGAVDGLEPIEIRSDLHPKAEKGAGATAVFNASAVRDAAGNIDPEALGNQEVQWLTQKMAGPASHEIFKGMTRDEVKASPATRSDFRQARAIVREVHPDFTPKQVEAVVDAAYDRAHDFLTKPHIADRIRANAAVREEGLNQALHASHGRVTQFAEDIRNAHNEYTGTEPKPDGGGAGEGGEKAEKPATEEGEKKAGGSEGGRGEGAPKSADESAKARGVAEQKEFEELNKGSNVKTTPKSFTPADVVESNVSKTPESQYPRTYQMDVIDDEGTKTVPVTAFSRKQAFANVQKKFPNAKEFNLNSDEGADTPHQSGYVVPKEKHLSTPNSASGIIPLENTMRHELGHYMVGHNEGLEARGVYRHTHPVISKGANAAVSWPTHDLIDYNTGKFKTEKIPSIIRMLMGGIAADEAFSGVPRNINHNFDPRMGGDGTSAINILRAAGYPESEINGVLHGAIDQAKEHLTHPAVSAIIQENAGVREPGLSKQYHYSGDRLREMGEEAKRRIQNGQYDNGQAGGKVGAGRAVDVAGREGEAAGALGRGIEESQINAIPKERTTGNPEHDEAIKTGGGIPGGVIKGFDYTDKTGQPKKYGDSLIFHDPKTGTSLGFAPDEEVTSEAVKAKLAASRAQYASANDPFEKAVKHYGTTNDINKAGYIGKDGRMLDFSDGRNARTLDHGDISEITGDSQAPRQNFVGDTGAVRVLKSRDYVGVQFDKSHPPTTAQLKQLLPWLEDKPKVEFEVSDREGSGSTVGGAMDRAETLEDLQQIVKDARLSAARRARQNLGLENSNISDAEKGAGTDPNDWVKKAEATKGEGFSYHPGTGEAPTDGFMVETHLDRGQQYDHPPTAEDIRAFTEKNKDLLSKNPELYVGGYKNSLGISERLTDQAAAEDLGKKTNQISIYDVKNGKEIPTGGTGEVSPNDQGYVYHSTAANNLPAIAEQGLSPSKDPQWGGELGNNSLGKVFFTHSPKDAHYYGEVNFREKLQNEGFAHAPVTIRTKVPEGIESSGKGTNKESWVKKSVSPENLEVYWGGKWHPISDAADYASEHSYKQEDDGSYSDSEGTPVGNSVSDVLTDAKKTSVPASKDLEESNISKQMPKGTKLDTDWEKFPGGIQKLTARDSAGKDIGHITVDTTKTPFVGHVTVNPSMQGQGIGENLYRSAIEEAKNQGAKKFQSDVASQISDDAQRVWKKLAASGDYNISKDGRGRWIVDLTAPKSPAEDFEQSQISKSPKGSSVPLMENPLPVKGTLDSGDVGLLDITKALNQFSREKNPALEPGSEPKEMVARAKKLAEDEAKYQLAQSKTGTEWYTTEMKDHDAELQKLRPELATGETVDSPDAPGHPVNLTLFKAAEAILSSGQRPYANVKSALRAWDLYKETGEFPPTNPATGKSWGPRHPSAYANAFESVNKLITEKGEKGAADWLLSEHPVSELKQYNKDVAGKKEDMRAGATILGEKRGPFMQNLHGIESKFTADMWVSRTWNRWMGTLDLDPRIESKGKMTLESDSPRNNGERNLMKESFQKTADKLGLTTSSLQAVLWYYEQALYRAHGIPVESWSFSDAAKRVAKEANTPESEQTAFDFGENKKPNADIKALGGLANLGSMTPKTDALGRPWGGKK
jgi:predicted GNAT family acetyltransferase